MQMTVRGEFSDRLTSWISEGIENLDCMATGHNYEVQYARVRALLDVQKLLTHNIIKCEEFEDPLEDPLERSVVDRYLDYINNTKNYRL